jgi:transposase
MVKRFTPKQRQLILSDAEKYEQQDTTKHDSTRRNTHAQLARRYGISERTIRRWQQPVSRASVCRGRKRKIAAAVEDDVIAWVNARLKGHAPVQQEHVIAYLHDTHRINVSPAYVSRLMRRNGFTSQRAQKRPEQRTRETYEEEVKAFRQQWCKTDCSNYLVMDEAGVWNDSVVLRSYAPRGTTPSIKTLPNASRDTVVATLKGDGTKLPLWYLEHKRQKTKNKVVIERAVKGMTEALMLQYIEEVLKPAVQPGDVLFMDRLSSHMTVNVRKKLEELKLTVVFFPAKSAPDLSPCDNVFFHLFKDNFRKKDRSTPALKKKAAFEAYDGVQEKNVRACFKKCGLLVSAAQEEQMQQEIADESDDEWDGYVSDDESADDLMEL